MNETATRLNNIMQVLRDSNVDVAAAADMLQFLRGLAQREPNAIPPAALERIDTKVIALLAQKSALESAITTLLSSIQASTDSARAGQMIELLFEHLEQRTADPKITTEDRSRRRMGAYRPTPRQQNE